MLVVDYVIDLGFGVGKYGGEFVGVGILEEFIKGYILIFDYLNNIWQIEVLKVCCKGIGEVFEFKGVEGNNLKKVNVKILLGILICVIGVLGSGKFIFINEMFYLILWQYFYKSLKLFMFYKSVKGLEKLDKVIEIDQLLIGWIFCLNLVIYIGVFIDICKIFFELLELKICGYKLGCFFFNVKGGCCEICKGFGMWVIEMNFLFDVYVECEICMGCCYNWEIFEVLYKGKLINDVLNMMVEEVVEFFELVFNIF